MNGEEILRITGPDLTRSGITLLVLIAAGIIIACVFMWFFSTPREKRATHKYVPPRKGPRRKGAASAEADALNKG